MHVTRVKTDFGSRAFSSAAPQMWIYHIPTAISLTITLLLQTSPENSLLCLAITLTT